jgi:hypothetical protein
MASSNWRFVTLSSRRILVFPFDSLDSCLKLLHFKGLGHVIRGARADDVHVSIIRTVAGHDDEIELRMDRLDAPHELDAVRAGHGDVGNDQLEKVSLEGGHGLGGLGAG